MADPTLTQVFGTSATQTATILTISKADLATVGLTASATNSAESLLVALVLIAKQYLTPDNFNTNTDQSITLEDGFETLITRGTGTARQKTINFNLFKAEPVVAIDPDDY